jgi:hypothetical protein
MLVVAAPSHAIVLTFDDVSVFQRAEVPAGYGGFFWEPSWETQTYSFYNSDWSNTLSPVSAGNHLVNYGNAEVAAITLGDDFVFNGAYLTGYTNHDEAQSYTASQVVFSGWRDGVEVANYTAYLTVGSMLYFETGWDMLLDVVVFRTPHTGDWFLMDNFTYNEDNSGSEIPEPASMLLLGLGLLGGASMRGRLSQ